MSVSSEGAGKTGQMQSHLSLDCLLFGEVPKAHVLIPKKLKMDMYTWVKDLRIIPEFKMLN